jgi:uncharacterized OB-fold protein
VLVHYILETEVLEVGQSVEPVLKQNRYRTGSILDLVGFRPIGD